jgi:hypothetical protein
VGIFPQTIRKNYMGYNDHYRKVSHEAKQALPIPELPVGHNHVVSDGRILDRLDRHPRTPGLQQVIYSLNPVTSGLGFSRKNCTAYNEKKIRHDRVGARPTYLVRKQSR